MISIIECPVCKNTDLQLLTRCIDFTVSHETFTVQLCKNCNLGITTPRPEDDQLGNYYRSEEYVSHSGKTSGGIGFVYKIARIFTLNWKKNLIQKYSKTGSILDFGCGTGEFLNSMKNSGWAIDGVEPSDGARAKAQQLTSQKISEKLSTQNQFDVITAWHVVEHVPNLNETVSKLKSHLKRNGIVFIAVPNFESPDAKKYHEHWAAFDVPRHLWHFSKKSMTQILTQNRLKLIDIVPMKLDAYYVSLLSEKYKNNNALTVGTILRALFAGFKSNINARNTNNSSLIYIAKADEI